MTEPWQPCLKMPLPIGEAAERGADLIEIPHRIAGQRTASALTVETKAHPQLVPPCPNGLDRRAGWEADLALDPVHLDGGGESVAILVDALGNADPTAG